MKNKILHIHKDFGSKTCPDVLCFESNGDIRDLSTAVCRDIIECDVIYICVADAEFSSDKIMGFMNNNNNPDFRIYLLTKKIDTGIWKDNHLRDKIIIHKIPDLSGNYFFTEKDGSANALYFTDRDCNGICCKDEKLINEIKKIFIKEFWNYSEEEYICGQLSDVTDDNRDFDIPPVFSSDVLILNQGIEEKSLVEKELAKAKSVFLKYVEPESYLESIMPELKKVCVRDFDTKEKNIFRELSESGKSVFYSPGNQLNFVQTNDSVFICNFNISDIDFRKRDRDNRLFMLKVKELASDDLFNSDSYSYGKQYVYKPSINYGEAVSKDLIDFEKKPVVINEFGKDEDKTTSPADIRTIKRNGDREDKWEEFLNSENVFNTQQPAVNINFNITIPAKVRTLKYEAKIYEQYINADKKIISGFESAIKDNKREADRKLSEINSKEKQKADLEKTVAKLADDVLNLSDEITKLNSERSTLTNTLDGLNSALVSADNTDKKLLKDNDKKIKKLNKQISDIAGDISNREKKISQKNIDIENKKKIISGITNDINTVQKQYDDFVARETEIGNLKDSVKHDVVTIEGVKENLTMLDNVYDSIGKAHENIVLPDFDKPKYGTLYQQGKSYEYEVDSEDNINQADSESREWGIGNVVMILKD